MNIRDNTVFKIGYKEFEEDMYIPMQSLIHVVMDWNLKRQNLFPWLPDTAMPINPYAVTWHIERSALLVCDTERR